MKTKMIKVEVLDWRTLTDHAEISKMFMGTNGKGQIDIDFWSLLATFGDPMEGEDYKVDAQWFIEFEDGTVASIYNFKNGRNYLGDEGKDVEDIGTWNFGGRGESSHIRKLIVDAIKFSVGI